VSCLLAFRNLHGSCAAGPSRLLLAEAGAMLARPALPLLSAASELWLLLLAALEPVLASLPLIRASWLHPSSLGGQRMIHTRPELAAN
jgi:hypothetical protein